MNIFKKKNRYYKKISQYIILYLIIFNNLKKKKKKKYKYYIYPFIKLKKLKKKKKRKVRLIQNNHPTIGIKMICDILQRINYFL